MPSLYKVTRINPRSLRSELLQIAEAQGKIPYPERSNTLWWLLWESEEPIGYFVSSSWELDNALFLSYHCLPQSANSLAWTSFLARFLELAAEEKFWCVYVIVYAKDENLQVALEAMGASPALFLEGRELWQISVGETKTSEACHKADLNPKRDCDDEQQDGPSNHLP